MTPTFLLGDNHGEYSTLLENLDARNIRDAVIIHVGDGHEGYLQEFLGESANSDPQSTLVPEFES
jgi:hypothetical protein